MQTYKNFRPTVYDTFGLGLEDKQEWLVIPVLHTRDSSALEESNFHTALNMLEKYESTETHTFNHWAHGWYEIIIVKPDTPEAAIAKEIESHLENYSVLDESDFSKREFEGACEAWNNLSIQERINILTRHKLSIFAARYDEIPQGLPYYDDFYKGE